MVTGVDCPDCQVDSLMAGRRFGYAMTTDSPSPEETIAALPIWSDVRDDRWPQDAVGVICRRCKRTWRLVGPDD